MQILTMRMKRTLVSILSGTSLVISTCTLAVADPNRGIESQISLGVAWERLEYKEHEPDTRIDSKAKINNVVVGIEGLKRWKYLFGGVKSVFPVFLESGNEEVTRSGQSFQTDNLELRWIRIDGFLGYPLRDWANPYLGIRWSEVRQERKHFIVAGRPVDLRSVEEVISWNLLLGVRGGGNFTPRLRWNYWLEYFLPLNVDVTNSAVPGFKATDKDGYMVELKGGLDYLYNRPSLAFGLLFYGGRMHWNASDWKSVDHVLAKWPENDTFYLGGGFKITYRF
jgi:hypothetical protein